MAAANTISEAVKSGNDAFGECEIPRLGNGCAMPSEKVPVLSFSVFRHQLMSMTRQGARVCAFFAVPAALMRGEGRQRREASTRTDEDFRLVAVLAEDSSGRLSIVSTEAWEGYDSLTPHLPQVHLFEREIYEKHGLLPKGHPWLKPVRFAKPDGPEIGSTNFFRIEGDEVHEVAVGPIHAGVIECGHFRFQCLGELVMHLEVSLGYHHRGVEALLEDGPHARTLPLMETLAGDSTIAHSWAYCSVLEALAARAPMPRGQLIRSLALEFERLANHTGDLGAMAGDVGFLSTLSFCGRLRGDLLNMSALLCGSRFGRGLLQPGGTAFDLDKNIISDLKKRLDATERDVQGALRLLWNSPSVIARFSGIGRLPRETASVLGVVGMAARASGLARDARHSHALSDLPRPPEIVLAETGDVRARAAVRHAEFTASANYCRRLLGDFLDGGEETAQYAASPEHPQPGAGAVAVALVEGWRGEVCHVAVTDENGRMAAYSVVDPSFHNWMGLAVALRDRQISDFPLCNKSFNLSYCGHDL